MFAICCIVTADSNDWSLTSSSSDEDDISESSASTHVSQLGVFGTRHGASKPTTLPDIQSKKEGSTKSGSDGAKSTKKGKHAKHAAEAKHLVPTHQIRSLHPEKIGNEDEQVVTLRNDAAQPGVNKATTTILLQVSEVDSGLVCRAQEGGRTYEQTRPQEGAPLSRRPWAFDATQRGRFDISKFSSGRKRGSVLANQTRTQAGHIALN